MYKEYDDIISGLLLYVNIVRDFKDEIKEINVENKIESSFGRKYCRVYINIILKEDAVKQGELGKRIFFDFNNRGLKTYFSFGLLTEIEDKNYILQNREENVHYDYIWNFMEKYLEKENVLVKAAKFRSQLDEKRDQEKILREYDLLETPLGKVVKDLEPEIGQLIAIKEYDNAPLRIGMVEKIILDIDKPFYVELLEMRTNMEIGKVKIRIWSKTTIHAIIKFPELKLPISRSTLIALIEKDENFEGLIWRRPQIYFLKNS
jgi:hypothetical protein